MKRILTLVTLCLCFSFAGINNNTISSVNISANLPNNVVLDDEANTFTETQTFDDLIKHSQATKTSAYTAATEEYLFCDATSGAFSITLPAVSAGLQYTIKKTDSSANLVTIDGNASEEIDGELTQVLTTQYDVITIVSDGTSWMTL